MKTHQIRSFRSAETLMRDNLLVKHYAGSHAYGTVLPTSDTDFRGIFCGDPVNIRTPFFNVRECEDQSEEDTKYYELAHFMKLCLDCNPNIVETLWVDESDIISRTPAYDLLREHRSSLLSSKIAFTTSGYAFAQLKRIRGHNKWINNPQPERPPQPCEFLMLIQWFGEEKMLPREFDVTKFRADHRLVPYSNDLYGLYYEPGRELYDREGGLNTTFEDERHLLDAPLAIVKFNKPEYKIAKEKHNLYWTWKQNRNETRSALEESFGYDTKHAMHLVRLLRMGKEALTTGQIIVKRPDAEELLSIRAGSWTYEEIVAYADEMDDEIRINLYKQTDLPKKPDLKFAARLLLDVQDIIWSKP